MDRHKNIYDIVPQNYIIECLKIFKISNKFIKFIMKSIKSCKVELVVGKQVQVEVKIQACNRYNFIKSQEKINHFMYMDYIKIFVKNEKELETLTQTIRIYRILNRIWNLECTMPIQKERRETKEGAEFQNQEITKTFEEKENYKYLGILKVNTIKNSTSEKKKTSQNQTQLHQSYQRNKHLGSASCKILWTILKMDKEGSQTDGLKDKEIDDGYKALLHLRDDIDKLYVLSHLISTRKPDLVLIHKKKRTCHLVNFPIPVDHSENERKQIDRQILGPEN